MIENNLISSNSVVAKLISDLDLKEDQIQISSIKEWIAEAVEKIGAIQQYDRNIVVTQFDNYQVKLPYDLHKLGQIGYGETEDCFQSVRKFKGSFGINSQITDEKSNNTYIPDSFKTNIQTTDNVDKNVYYTQKPGYLNINRKDGFIRMEYYKISTDEDGMPLIPDMVSYQEAIFWYVAMKMTYPKYLKGTINPRIYYDMKNSWAFYRKQAYAEAMMPDQGDMESIKNMWNRLYPEQSDYDQFFNNLGNKQIIYTH